MASTVLVLAACTTSTSGGPEPPEEPGASPSGPAVVACTEDVVAAIDDTIAAQLRAFVAEDWGEALRHATPDFQSGMSPERFRDVITQGFPVAAVAASHQSLECVGTELVVQVLVEVRAEDGRTSRLRYLLANAGDRWLIGGAQLADDDSVAV